MGGPRKDIARRASTTTSSSTAGHSSVGDVEGLPTPRVKKWAPKVRTGCLTCRFVYYFEIQLSDFVYSVLEMCNLYLSLLIRERRKLTLGGVSQGSACEM